MTRITVFEHPPGNSHPVCWSQRWRRAVFMPCFKVFLRSLQSPSLPLTKTGTLWSRYVAERILRELTRLEIAAFNYYRMLALNNKLEVFLMTFLTVVPSVTVWKVASLYLTMQYSQNGYSHIHTRTHGSQMSSTITHPCCFTILLNQNCLNRQFNQSQTNCCVLIKSCSSEFVEVVSSNANVCQSVWISKNTMKIY